MKQVRVDYLTGLLLDPELSQQINGLTEKKETDESDLINASEVYPFKLKIRPCKLETECLQQHNLQIL